MTRTSLPWTAAAVTATALAGGAGTDLRSRWYRRLDKPSWQPPGPVFGPVWTTLYASLAYASARALDRGAPAGEERRRYLTAFGLNLALNAGWTWSFFRLKRPAVALAEITVFLASTFDLVRRTARHDRQAGAILVPYLAWAAFASVLTAELARRNR